MACKLNQIKINKTKTKRHQQKSIPRTGGGSEWVTGTGVILYVSKLNTNKNKKIKKNYGP